MLGKQPQAVVVYDGEHVVPGVDRFPVKMLPVVESSPLELLFVHTKTGRFDDPQLGAESDAASSDITCVLRYFRLVKDDV